MKSGKTSEVERIRRELARDEKYLDSLFARKRELPEALKAALAEAEARFHRECERLRERFGALGSRIDEQIQAQTTVVEGRRRLAEVAQLEPVAAKERVPSRPRRFGGPPNLPSQPDPDYPKPGTTGEIILSYLRNAGERGADRDELIGILQEQGRLTRSLDKAKNVEWQVYYLRKHGHSVEKVPGTQHFRMTTE